MHNVFLRIKNLSATKRILTSVGILLVVLFVFCLPRQLFQVPYSTVVTSSDGTLLGARIATDGQWRFPPRDTVPSKLATCIITFEDQYFRWHWGVNPLAIGRAVVQNIRNQRIVSGGSTITMQTIRLARGEQRTLGEKLIEAIWAMRLEFSHSKRKILALYASHAPFGGNVVGIDAAAWRYFGHTADDLSWGEAATLAVLPNAPALIHLSRQRESLLAKRNRLLQRLFDSGEISESELDLALSEPLPEAPLPLPTLAPHVVEYFAHAQNGKTTRTTIDAALQQRIEQIAMHHHNRLVGNQISNLAVLVANVETNEVVAYCGNVGYGSGLNGANVDVVRSPRCTGSILKPLLYFAMLRDGELLPRTLLPDVPINISGYAPQNYSHEYAGMVHADEAIARSLNIPAVVMLQRYTVPRFYNELKRMRFNTLSHEPMHYGLSLILGGAEATLWDVVNAYKRLACYALADQATANSELCLSATEALAFSESKTPTMPDAATQVAAWQTLEALTNVVRPEEIDWKQIASARTIGWKTGTSHGFRDAWAVGTTPRYVVGVWVGNASGEGRPGLLGGQAAAPLLFDVFEALPRNQWFEQPAAATCQAEICPQSGMLRSRFCPEADTVVIVDRGLDTDVCPYHSLVTLTADERHRVFVGNAAHCQTVQKAWFTLPPVAEWYYSRQHPEYQPLPPLLTSSTDDVSPIQFIYPQPNSQIQLRRQMDGSEGSFVAQIAHRSTDAEVHWHLDNRYQCSTTNYHNITLSPTAGKHTLVAVDDKGNTTSVSFTIN